MTDSEEIKKLVLARLGTLNPDSKILLLGNGGPISVSDMIKEINQDTDFGKKLVEVHFSFIKFLAKGEIDEVTSNG